MHTQKIAITIPRHIVATIDEMSKQKGLSRSRLISIIIKEKIVEEKKKQVKEAYDRVFSDESICQEQLDWTRLQEETAAEEWQEW